MEHRLPEGHDAARRGQRWTGCRLVSAVPPSHRREGMEWLSIEHGPADKGGYVLLCFRRREAQAGPESWHCTLQSALIEARAKWGVDVGCWTIE